jgi:hypothetical protein
MKSTKYDNASETKTLQPPIFPKLPKLSNIPSCGLALLKGPLNSFDYVLRITSNDQNFVHINCHRCVLLAHSATMSDLIRNENFWDMDIKVEPGYISATIELIQYMYLKDITLISNKAKVLELCALFEMPLDFFLIRTDGLDCLNTYPRIQLAIEFDKSNCLTMVDFLKKMKITSAIGHRNDTKDIGVNTEVSVNTDTSDNTDTIVSANTDTSISDNMKVSGNKHNSSSDTPDIDMDTSNETMHHEKAPITKKSAKQLLLLTENKSQRLRRSTRHRK